jgi:uncharacterized membrane protein
MTAIDGTLLGILAMAAATYPMRVGGFWIMGRVPLTPRVRRMLEASPGAVIVATILPIIVRDGAPAAIAVLAGGTVMLVWRRDYLAVAAGMVAAAAWRSLMP